VWKFGYEIPNGCGDNEGVDNFVAWEEQIIMLKTGSKSVRKWWRYNRLKFDAIRKRIWEVC